MKKRILVSKRRKRYKLMVKGYSVHRNILFKFTNLNIPKEWKEQEENDALLVKEKEPFILEIKRQVKL